MDQEYMQMLYLELTSYENQGVTLWLEGYPSNPENVTGKLAVGEDGAYMRDYIFDEGVLYCQFCFDKRYRYSGHTHLTAVFLKNRLTSMILPFCMLQYAGKILT